MGDTAETTDTTTFHNNVWRTTRPGRLANSLIVTEGPSGYEVYRSPEFQALCRLLGVDWSANTKEIELRLTETRTVVIQTVQDRPMREAEVSGLPKPGEPYTPPPVFEPEKIVVRLEPDTSRFVDAVEQLVVKINGEPVPVS